MAFHALKVHCSLWPWREAGLRHWLLDTPEAAEAVRKPPRAAVSPRPQPVQSAQTPSAQAPHTPREPFRPGGRPVPVTQSAPPSVSAPAATPVQPSAITTRPDILPQERWPEAWQALFARCPKRPTVVWTYPAMTDDYGGRSDPARRAFLQRLLKDMAMPAGSNAFWPMTPPPYDVPRAGATDDADPIFFHSGIAALKPAVVLFFGPAPQALNLPQIPLLSSLLVEGRLMGQVHPIDVLAGPFKADSTMEERTVGRGRHEVLVQFLKSMFGSISV